MLTMVGVDPRIGDVMRKAAVVWLGRPGGHACLVWCRWHNDALYVVTGPGEQAAPALATAAVVTVSTRGDHGGRILTWTAQVRRLVPGSPPWRDAVAVLAAGRLNSAAPQELANRWATECVINQLVPMGNPSDGTQAAGVNQ